MDDIKQLFFHLTPTTLAAIVTDLDDNHAMYRQRQAAIDAGYDNCGEEFWAMLDAERDSRIEANSDPKFTNNIEAILARQS